MKIGAAEPASPVIRGHYPSRLAEVKSLVKPPNRARPGHSGARGDPRVLPRRPLSGAGSRGLRRPSPSPADTCRRRETDRGTERAAVLQGNSGNGENSNFRDAWGSSPPKIKPRRRLHSQPPQVRARPFLRGYHGPRLRRGNPPAPKSVQLRSCPETAA